MYSSKILKALLLIIISQQLSYAADHRSEKKKREKLAAACRTAALTLNTFTPLIKNLPPIQQAIVLTGSIVVIESGLEGYEELLDTLHAHKMHGINRLPLQSQIQHLQLTEEDFKRDALIAKKQRGNELMQRAAQQKNKINELKNMIAVQGVVDNTIQQKDDANQKIGLADLMQRKNLVYAPGLENVQVQTVTKFDGTVQVSGNQVVAIGSNSFLVGGSPEIIVSQNGQDSIALYPEHPALLLGTSFEWEGEMLSLQDVSTTNILQLF